MSPRSKLLVVLVSITMQLFQSEFVFVALLMMSHIGTRIKLHCGVFWGSLAQIFTYQILFKSLSFMMCVLVCVFGHESLKLCR